RASRRRPSGRTMSSPIRSRYPMKAFVRGAAVLLTTAATLIGAAASAQDKTVLTTEREKTSYMVGTDIAQSIAPVAPDIDLAAFERAISNAFDGGKPLITED